MSYQPLCLCVINSKFEKLSTLKKIVIKIFLPTFFTDKLLTLFWHLFYVIIFVLFTMLLSTLEFYQLCM
jgi:hypothetical protein